LFEVPDPEVMGVVPGPTFSHLLFDDAELEAGCAGTFKMAIQGGARETNAIEIFEKPVDGGMGAPGLLTFELDGTFNDLRGSGPGMAPVIAALSCKSIKAFRAIEIQLSPEGGKRWLSRTSAGEDHLLLGELF